MAVYLKGIIDRVEGDFLIIKFSGDQEIYWPKNNVDFVFNDGDAINLVLTQDEPETVSKEAQAKNLLRQVFQSNA
jgi:hypothetical protein